MSSDWEVAYMSRKRRRSARKSGNKKTRQLQDTISEGEAEFCISQSVASTVSIIQEANETLENNTMLNNSAQPTQFTLPGTNLMSAGVSADCAGQQQSGSIPTVSVGNPFGPLSTTGTTTNPVFSTPGISGISPAQNLQQYGNTSDATTALILQEVQSLRVEMKTEIKTEIAAICANTVKQQLNIAFTELAGKYDKRFSDLETKVTQLEEENRRLRQNMSNISVQGGPDGATINSIVDDAVNRTMQEKDVLVRKQFDYDRTVAITGIRWSPTENCEEVAKQLVHQGLGLTDVKIVRATRTPYNHRLNRPGLFKIELENVDVKKRVLGESHKLRNYTALGHKIVMRTSQTHEMRTQVGNWRTFIQGCNMEDMFSVSKSGTLMPRGPAAAHLQATGQYRFQSNPQQTYQQQTYPQQPPPRYPQQPPPRGPQPRPPQPRGAAFATNGYQQQNQGNSNAPNYHQPSNYGSQLFNPSAPTFASVVQNGQQQQGTRPQFANPLSQFYTDGGV